MGQEVSPTLTRGSRHSITVRRPDLPFAADIPRHWADGNAVASHIFNALNLTFPEGERFFIRAVNDCVAEIEDPALAQQARAFAGQEAVHGREHERYFDVLRAQGYRIDRFVRRFGRFIALMNRMPRSLRLAMTAGAEHYTATLGHFAISNPETRKFHPTMQALIVWHAVEEVEHKAVAYDVMQAAGISYFTRILGYGLATFTLLGWAAIGCRMLVRQDGITRSEAKLLRQQLEAKVDPALIEHTRRQLRAYFRRDFHPNDVDDYDLAHARLAEIDLIAAA
jgi:predicted metal-dependent hydrolase